MSLMKLVEKFSKLNITFYIEDNELLIEANEGIITNEILEEIKKNTRRFAKRQLTWFKRDKETLWFDTKTDIENIISVISEKMNTFKEK